jgi:hypothetical protein
MFNNANICLKVLNLTYKTFLFSGDDGDKDGKLPLLNIFLLHKICYILPTFLLASKDVIFCLHFTSTVLSSNGIAVNILNELYHFAQAAQLNLFKN